MKLYTVDSFVWDAALWLADLVLCLSQVFTLLLAQMVCAPEVRVHCHQAIGKCPDVVIDSSNLLVYTGSFLWQQKMRKCLFKTSLT